MVRALRSGPTALIIVDMQNGFCHPKGFMSKLGFNIHLCREAVRPTVALTQAVRRAHIPIFFTRYVFRPDYKDGGILVRELFPGITKVRGLAAGSWDARIVREIKVEKGDFVIEKNRYSSFFNTNLESQLRNLGVENLLVAGVVTNMCVETTVRDAVQRDFRVFLVADACGAVDAAMHAATIATVNYGFGTVVSTEEALDYLRAAFSKAPRGSSRRPMS